jgi:hypothetical protein
VQNERQSLKVVDVQVQIRVVRECREDDGADRLDVTVVSWRPELSITVEGSLQDSDDKWSTVARCGGRHAREANKEIGEQAGPLQRFNRVKLRHTVVDRRPRHRLCNVMTSLHIFLGAPSRSDLENAEALEYSWQTVTVCPMATSTSESEPVFPPATLAAAGRRLSAIYGNMIFKDEEDEPNLEESDMTRDHAHGASGVSICLNLRSSCPQEQLPS